MANQIQLPNWTTGVTVYAIIRDADGKVWRATTNAFETYATANLANYAVAMTEQGTASRFYVGTFPSGRPSGVYGISFYQRAGATPAETDNYIGSVNFDHHE